MKCFGIVLEVITSFPHRGTSLSGVLLSPLGIILAAAAAAAAAAVAAVEIGIENARGVCQVN